MNHLSTEKTKCRKPQRSANAAIPETIAASDLAALTGLSDRRHRQLAERGYMPVPVRGVYKLRPAVAGVVKYYQQRAKAEDPLSKARLEEIESRTELNRLAIDQKRGQLAPVAEVAAIYNKYLASAKSRIDGDPKLGREEKDKIIEDLGHLLDVAFGVPSPTAPAQPKRRRGNSTEGC